MKQDQRFVALHWVKSLFLTLLLLSFLSGCSLFQWGGEKKGTSNQPAGPSNQTTDQNTQGKEDQPNAGQSSGEEGTTGDSLVKEYPWYSKLDETDQQAIRDLFNNSYFQNLPPIPTTLSEVLSHPQGKLAGFEGDKLEAEIDMIKLSFPIVKPYDDEDYYIKKYPNLDETTANEIAKTIQKKTAEAVVSLAWERFPRAEDIYKGYVKPALPQGNAPTGYQQVPYRMQANVEIILDASGSMKEKIGDRTKMELAKEAIQSFLGGLPKGVNVSLRLFGHKEAPTKEESCQISELVYPPGPYQEERFGQHLNVTPVGWTNLAQSVKLAGEDLSGYKGETYTNIVVIVSDGAETCGGDPIKEADSLKKSEVQPYFHLIGFNADEAGQAQLSEIAKKVGGIYRDAKDAEGLKNELKPLGDWLSGWEKWRQDALKSVQSQRKEIADRLGKTDEDWKAISTRVVDRINAIKSKLTEVDKIGYSDTADFLLYRINYSSMPEEQSTLKYLLEKAGAAYFQTLIAKIDQDYSQVIEEIDRTFEAQKKLQTP